MTTTHDTGISWTECPVCVGLHRAYEQARAEAEKAWESYESVDFQYRQALDDGRCGFGTSSWTRWHDLLDELRHTYYDLADAEHERLGAWGASILQHAKPQPQEAAEAPAETEEMSAVDREKKTTISRADVAAEQAALAELWYGDVPDFDLPDEIMDGSWSLLHAASAAISVYMRLLEQYAPVTAKGYPAWVANRLRDVLDETAIQRAVTDQGDRK